MIIPRIQNEVIIEGKHELGSAVKYFAADDFGARAAKLFKYFLPTVSFIAVKSRSDAQLIFDCRFGICERDEFYKITSNEMPIYVNYRDFLGARNAVATISQLLIRENGVLYFPRVEVLDYPTSKMRSLMIDPARCIIPVADIEEILIRMAMTKHNYIHLHLGDERGYAIKSDVVNYGGPFGKQYTKDEIRHIVKFALDLGIECIPEIDFPGHAFQLLEEMPNLACVTDGSENPSPWAVCAGNEETYIFLEKLYTELAELFPCKIMHVGTDEIEMNDRTDILTWPTWHCCYRCRELCEREGIDQNNRTEIFYYMLRRIYAVLSKLGKRLMMWNDNIDISKSPELPRDILIHFWRVAGWKRGPSEGCSMQRFLEEGFEVFNSYYPETYIEEDFYRNKDETIVVWDPTTIPEHDNALDSQILGGEPCAWGSSCEAPVEHFQWSLPPSIFMFGDRFWNKSVCDDLGQFGIAATKLLFGIDVPKDFNLFEKFGGFMQPRSYTGVRMWPDKAAEDLSEVDAVLEKLENSYTMYGRFARIYRESIKWLNEKRAEEAQN